MKALYEVQRAISKDLLAQYVGTTIEVICDGIDYEKSCFVGRAYFNAPDIDGKVYFYSMDAMQGKRYQVRITSADEYDVYGSTEDYLDEVEFAH